MKTLSANCLPIEIMHKVVSLFIASWIRAQSYRGDVFFWSLSEVVAPVVALALWYNVAAAGAGPLSARDVLTYYLAVLFVYSFTDVWNGFFLAREILNGKIVEFLIRPIPFFWVYIFRNITGKMMRLPGQIVFFGVVIGLFSTALSPAIYQWQHILPFAISIVCGLGIAFWMDMNFAMLAFWLEDAVQIRQYKEIVHNVASGLLIPLVFLPPFIQNVLSWLPFRYVISAPIEILLGQVSGWAVWQLIAIQLVWIAAFALLLRFLWRKGLSVYALPGQ